TENDVAPPPSESYPRASEAVAIRLAERGVHASVIRLPQVHDTVKQGLITPLIQIYREKGVCAYVGEGDDRFAAVHVLDAAPVYRLALERDETGARYHAVAEEGVSWRAIAEAIGRRLDLPVQSIAADEAEAFFGWFAMFAGIEFTATSQLTRAWLGWEPVHPGLIDDLDHGQY